MGQNEMMKRFEELYNKMAASGDKKNMYIFGGVMKCMMKDMVDWKPEIAMEYIDKLEAIEWCNYLSKKEAVEIVSNMNPKGGYDIADYERWIEAEDYYIEEMPYYKKWALYVVMNMIYSDSMKSITAIAGKSMNDEEIFKAIHTLALDKLKDKDRVFDVRKYFGL